MSELEVELFRRARIHLDGNAEPTIRTQANSEMAFRPTTNVDGIYDIVGHEKGGIMIEMRMNSTYPKWRIIASQGYPGLKSWPTDKLACTDLIERLKRHQVLDDLANA